MNRTESTQFSFTIADPQNRRKMKIGKTEFKTHKYCAPQDTNKDEDGGKAENKGDNETRNETHLPPPPIKGPDHHGHHHCCLWQ